MLTHVAANEMLRRSRPQDKKNAGTTNRTYLKEHILYTTIKVLTICHVKQRADFLRYNGIGS